MFRKDHVQLGYATNAVLGSTEIRLIMPDSYGLIVKEIVAAGFFVTPVESMDIANNNKANRSTDHLNHPVPAVAPCAKSRMCA